MVNPSRLQRVLLLVVTSFLLQGCYSLACVRNDFTIQAPDRHKCVKVDVWEQEPGFAETDFLKATLVSVVAYPLDVIASSVCAVHAMVDPETRVRWGPLGALAGITLPGLTLLPSRFKRPSAGEIWIGPRQFDELLEAIRAGRIQEGLRKVEKLWTSHVLAVDFVEVADVPRRVPIGGPDR